MDLPYIVLETIRAVDTLRASEHDYSLARCLCSRPLANYLLPALFRPAIAYPGS